MWGHNHSASYWDSNVDYTVKPGEQIASGDRIIPDTAGVPLEFTNLSAGYQKGNNSPYFSTVEVTATSFSVQRYKYSESKKTITEDTQARIDVTRRDPRPELPGWLVCRRTGWRRRKHGRRAGPLPARIQVPGVRGRGTRWSRAADQSALLCERWCALAMAGRHAEPAHRSDWLSC